MKLTSLYIIKDSDTNTNEFLNLFSCVGVELFHLPEGNCCVSF